MDLNNRFTEDETLDQAYDIFLELAGDNLDPADVAIFNLQFEACGAAELYDPADDWHEHINFIPDPEFFCEVIIGLSKAEDQPVTEIFARILICRERDNKFCHILWRK